MNGLHAVVYFDNFVAIQSTEDRQLHCSTLYVQINAFIEAHSTRFMYVWNDSDNTFA